MQTTFLHNNEQIIADLANLELEQERQIFQIVFDTFSAQGGLAELEDLTVLGKALGFAPEEVEDLCKQANEDFQGFLDFDQFCDFLSRLDPSMFKQSNSPNKNANQIQEEKLISESQQEEEKKLEDTIEKKENDPQAETQDQAKEDHDKELDKINQQAPKLSDYKDNAIVPSNGVALTPDSRVLKLIKQLNNYFRN